MSINSCCSLALRAASACAAAWAAAWAAELSDVTEASVTVNVKVCVAEPAAFVAVIV